MLLFFMKEIKGAILSQNHRRSQGGGGPRRPGPHNRNASNEKKIDKKALLFYFQFVSASLRTTVHAYNSN